MSALRGLLRLGLCIELLSVVIQRLQQVGHLGESLEHSLFIVAALTRMASTAARFSARSVPPSKIGAVRPESRLHAVSAQLKSCPALTACCPTVAVS